MTQLSLGIKDTRPAATPKWVKYDGNATVHSEWHHASGYVVRHCGHPTAHYPYYVTHPPLLKPIVGKFAKLAQAQAAVEEVT